MSTQSGQGPGDGGKRAPAGQKKTAAPKKRIRMTAAEAALARRIAELEDANRELEAFNVAVAHEMRAPLRVIEAMGGILGEDHEAVLPADARGLLRIMRETSGRLNKMIDDLLCLSRLARHPLKRARVDLGALAEAAVATLRRSDPRREVELRVAPNLTAWCDPELARALIDALLSNAWKFTAAREQAVIEFGRANGDSGAFVLRDNGTGFDMQYAARLFTPFQRLHAYEEAAGAGLGLTLVRRIVERHAGRVWAEGAAQGGAAFYFLLE